MRPIVEKEIEEILMLHFGSPAERKRWCESVQETFEGFGPQEYIYTEPDAPRESDQSEDATQPKAAMQEHSKPSTT